MIKETTQPAQDEDVAAFEAALQKESQRNYAVADATQPNSLTFNSGNAEWVMRITADRRIEVNENVEVGEAAQKVLDALQNLLPVQEPVAVKRMKEWVEFLKRQSDNGQHMNIPSSFGAGTCWELAIELEQFINTHPPQRTWVGLTDEDCKGMNADDKLIVMWADRTLKEKNNG